MPSLPCYATRIGQIRRVLGEAGVVQLLNRGGLDHESGQTRRVQVRHRTDDSVWKGIATPTESRLLEVPQPKIMHLATSAGIGLTNTFGRETKLLCCKARGHAHARKFKRLRRATKRQRVILCIALPGTR